MSERANSYASAVADVARAEGNFEQVSDELFRVARALEASDELRMTLSDRAIPASRRQQIVEDLLGGAASDVTTAVVSMIVGSGRASELGRIAAEAVEMCATESGQAVAEVRTAIELTEDQRQRLAASLSTVTGRNIQVKVIVDPSVLGGVVTTIGDEIIDGSVRSRLKQLREVL